MRSNLIIAGTCSAFVAVLIAGASVSAGSAFEPTINPAHKNHFSMDKANWWTELPIEALPTRSGIYNQESWDNEKEALRSLITGKFTLGEIPNVAVSQSNDGSVEIALSTEITDCGAITDEVRLKRIGFADVDDDGVVEQCVFIGRANKSDACLMGSGNFLGYGSWLVFEKDTAKSAVALIGNSETKCSAGERKL
jgi:hypothetical protein